MPVQSFDLETRRTDPLARLSRTWEYNIKIDFKFITFYSVGLTLLFSEQ